MEYNGHRKWLSTDWDLENFPELEQIHRIEHELYYGNLDEEQVSKKITKMMSLTHDVLNKSIKPKDTI